MAKHGLGKNIQISGGFQEGTWDNDRLTGLHCRVYDSATGDMYAGEIAEGKRSGKGRLLDKQKDEVYEGEFENDKRAGEGTVYTRDGNVIKGFFRAGVMEGDCEYIQRGLTKEQVDLIFEAAMSQNPNFISFNKRNERRCLEGIRKTVAAKNSFPDQLGRE